MRKIICLLFLLSTPLYAQVTNVTKAAKFEWSQEGSSVSNVHTWQFQLELDSILQSKLLATFCTGDASPYNCTAPLPPITTTTHTARIRVKGLDQDGKLITTIWSNKVTFKVTNATTVINIFPPKDLKVIEQ